MIALRIHLDETGAGNGCLKIIPASHKLGVLTAEQIQAIVATQTPVVCAAQKRAALIMRPHLVHASSKSLEPNNRRVVHFEFSDWCLPTGISWR